MTVEEATQRDLDRIAERDQELAESGLAASALALSREIDKPENSATSKSMCAKSLLDTMNRLRELAPPVRGVNPLDEIRARRDQRVAGSAGAAR